MVAKKEKRKKKKRKKEKSRIKFAPYRAVQYVRRCKYVNINEEQKQRGGNNLQSNS